MEEVLSRSKGNKVVSLNKKWKEVLYAFSGFGPNFLMVLMGAYYSDAINPTAMGSGGSQAGQVITGFCLVFPILFSVLMILGKIFDGVIDIPFASITDNLNTKWGRRRPPIAICFIPMVLSFALCWLPLFRSSSITVGQQIGNTIWFIFWALIFFATYTMCLIAFYGSLSNVCVNESQRLRVSSFKSFFDTISYCIVYALVPLILQGLSKGLGWGIDKFVFLSLPLMFTMIIPLFMIKEGKKYGYPENEGKEVNEKIKLGESFKITFKNPIFKRWLVVNCCSFFGLQMFLVAMNAMIIGGMGFNGLEMALANTCAFAPVPIMLYLFNKLKNKKGIRFAYQTCLLAFSLSIMSFFFGSTFICGTNNKTIQLIIACAGGVLGSWSIGSFFMMPYLVPAQISSVEEKLLGKNHSAMYFAAQAFTTSVVGAVASYGVYDILKNIFITKDFKMVWNTKVGNYSDALEYAAKELLHVDTSAVFNFGTLIVPFIVAIMCILGFVFAFKMPKDYTPNIVATEFKRFYPELDISNVSTIEDESIEEKGEIIFVQIALWVLSGGIFGFIWLAILLSNKIFKEKTLLKIIKGILSCLIPFFGIYVLLNVNKMLSKTAEEKGITLKNHRLIYVLSSIILPILPLNFIALSFLQKDVNKVLKG